MIGRRCAPRSWQYYGREEEGEEGVGNLIMDDTAHSSKPTNLAKLMATELIIGLQHVDDFPRLPHTLQILPCSETITPCIKINKETANQ